MKNNKYLYLLAGILIGVIGVWVLNYSNIGITRNPAGMMGQRNNIVQNSDVIDAHFIEQMIPHHEDAITMSELALEKATKPEVKELAQNIITSQTKEIEQMSAWYKDWFGKEVPQDASTMGMHGMMGSARPNSMHMGIMGGDADIESLENSEDFDREFIEQMIPHHQMAVMMANMLVNSTKREEMKNLGENIIETQSSEIELMRNWLEAWNE
jgi:uncharacterized protein (DUF305 family)